MKYPFSFKVIGYEDGGNKFYEQNGMGICRGYSDAVSIIEKEFGDELVSIKHLEVYDSGRLIYMPNEVVTKIVSEYFDGTKTYEVPITKEEARKI